MCVASGKQKKAIYVMKDPGYIYSLPERIDISQQQADQEGKECVCLPPQQREEGVKERKRREEEKKGSLTYSVCVYVYVCYVADERGGLIFLLLDPVGLSTGSSCGGGRVRREATCFVLQGRGRR